MASGLSAKRRGAQRVLPATVIAASETPSVPRHDLVGALGKPTDSWDAKEGADPAGTRNEIEDLFDCPSSLQPPRLQRDELDSKP